MHGRSLEYNTTDTDTQNTRKFMRTFTDAPLAHNNSPGKNGHNGDNQGGVREYFVGQTVPQPTGASPEWASVGGGGGGGRGAGGGGTGGSAASARLSSVSMADQSRGPGLLSSRSDAVLQVRMVARGVWCLSFCVTRVYPCWVDSDLSGDREGVDREGGGFRRVVNC